VRALRLRVLTLPRGNRRRRCGADKSDSSWTEIEHAKKRILENVVKVSMPEP
jgi:hypothetical protein